MKSDLSSAGTSASITRTTKKRYRVAVYLALTAAFFLSLTAMNAVWEFHGCNDLNSQIHRLVDALLLALPAWGLRKKRWLFPWVAAVTIYLLSNVWYYRNYGTLMPLSSYLMVYNLPTIGRSLWLSLRTTDLLLLLPPLLFMGWYAGVGYRWSNPQGEGKYSRFRILTTGFCLLVIVLITTPPYLCYNNMDMGYPCRRFQMEPILAVRKYSMLHFWIAQFQQMKRCTPGEIGFATNYVQAAEQLHPRTQLVEPHRRNLILILTESLCAWPVGLEVGGTEVTPYLNSLARDTTVLYFPKVLPQVKDGRSSDAQLLLNTGLLPLASGAAAGIYGLNTYPSLPKALKEQGYTSISLTCDNRTVWNQDATSRSYGFDRLYERMDQGRLCPESDSILFERTLSILQKLRKPFYAQIVTFSGHDPVETTFGSALRQAGIPDRNVMNYLIITQFVDRSIGRFIEALREAGLYDESIVVIVGDHDSTITRNRYEGRTERTLEDRYIPLFVLNAPLKTETGKVIAQSDIYPSLLDLMGAADYPFHGLGESVFRHQSDCAADFDGEWAGGNTDDSVRRRRLEAWRVSDILLRSDHFAGSF